MNARASIALMLLAAAAIVAAAEPPETGGPQPAAQQPAAGSPPPATEPGPQKTPGTGPIDPAPPAAPEPPKPQPARTISGKVTSVEGNPPRAVVDTAGGPIAIAIDRNTAIYLKYGWGTVRDVRSGEQVRVSISGSENRAQWLEVLATDEAAEKRDESAITPPAIPPGEMSSPAGPPPSAGVPPGPATPGTAPGP